MISPAARTAAPTMSATNPASVHHPQVSTNPSPKPGLAGPSARILLPEPLKCLAAVGSHGWRLRPATDAPRVPHRRSPNAAPRPCLRLRDRPRLPVPVGPPPRPPRRWGRTSRQCATPRSARPAHRRSRSPSRPHCSLRPLIRMLPIVLLPVRDHSPQIRPNRVGIDGPRSTRILPTTTTFDRLRGWDSNPQPTD